MGANAIAGRPASNWSKHSVIKFEGRDSIIQVEAQNLCFLHIVEERYGGKPSGKHRKNCETALFYVWIVENVF